MKYGEIIFSEIEKYLVKVPKNFTHILEKCWVNFRRLIVHVIDKEGSVWRRRRLSPL